MFGFMQRSYSIDYLTKCVKLLKRKVSSEEIFRLDLDFKAKA